MRVAGRIDLVRRLDTDETAIRDFKSHGHTQTDTQSAVQLTTCARGYHKLTGKHAHYIETYDLNWGKVKGAPVDDRFLRKVDGRILRVVDALHTNTPPPKPSPTKCADSDFQRMCAAACKD